MIIKGNQYTVNPSRVVSLHFHPKSLLRHVMSQQEILPGQGFLNKLPQQKMVG